VRYEIRPVGDMRPGLEPVPPNGLDFADIMERDADDRPVRDASRGVAHHVVMLETAVPHRAGQHAIERDGNAAGQAHLAAMGVA